MKKIKIKKQINDKLIRVRGYYCSKMFLLGQNSKGIVTVAQKLADSGDGCEWMSGIDSYALTKAYINMAKNKIIPIGFANVVNTRNLSWNGERMRGRWSGYFGPSIFRNRGMVFVIYDPEPRAVMAKPTMKGESLNRRTYEVKVEII